MRTGEWNFSPAGDTSITRLASASRSMKGGGYATAESGVYLQHYRNVLTNIAPVSQRIAVSAPALYPGGLLHGGRGDDHPHAPVAVPRHGAAPGVHQEADQEVSLLRPGPRV